MLVISFMTIAESKINMLRSEISNDIRGASEQLKALSKAQKKGFKKVYKLLNKIK